MADNTTLDPGADGDRMRSKDRGTAKTCVSLIDVGGTASESLIGDGGAMPISDNGGSLTVDGTVAATQSGTWTVQPGNTANTTAWKVDGSAVTQPVSAASLPLPSGASTAAKQPALGTAGTASADVITIQGVASMTPVAVSDNSGSLTVDGTVAATQSGTWTVTGTGGTFPVTDSGGSLTVDGTVAVSGTVAVTQSGTWDEVGINDSGNSITVDDGSSSLTVDNAGTFVVQVDGTALTRLTDIETNTDSGAVVGNGAAATAQRVTLANDSTGIVALTTSTASIGKLAANSGVDIGDVDVTSVPAPLSTTGGGTEATALRVTIASDSTGVLSIDDNGGAITVDGTVAVSGTVAVTQSGTWDEVGINDSGNSITVDNGGTFAVQSADRNGVILRPSITTSASPDYSANDVVSGIVTLSSVMSASGRQAVLKSLVVKDASGQAPALSFMFFRTTPSGGTYTDNSALVWGTNDLANMTGVVRVLSTDWYTLVSKSLAAFGGLDQLMGSANSDLYMLIVADATWNAASTSDLTVELAFEQR